MPDLRREPCNSICAGDRSAGARLTSERGARYGTPKANFGRAALIWEAVLGSPVTPEQVALCLLGVKLARLVETPDDPDSIADLAGYAATLDLLAGRAPTV